MKSSDKKQATMKLKERLVMVTLGFSIAIVLFVFQEYYLVRSIRSRPISSKDDKVSGNRFHGQIRGNAKKKDVQDEPIPVPINFKQRNLQKTGSGSNAASGTGENTDPTKGPLENEVPAR